MFLVVTRNFPPDVGGMQTLMGGLSESLINHGPVKVFTYEFPNSGQFDNNSELNVERIGGIKPAFSHSLKDIFVGPISTLSLSKIVPSGLYFTFPGLIFLIFEVFFFDF